MRNTFLHPPPPPILVCCYVPLIPGYQIPLSSRQADIAQHSLNAASITQSPFSPTTFSFIHCLLNHLQLRIPIIVMGLSEGKEKWDVGKKIVQEDSLWKDSCLPSMFSLILWCFPIKEAFGLTSKHILQKRQKQEEIENL